MNLPSLLKLCALTVGLLLAGFAQAQSSQAQSWSELLLELRAAHSAGDETQASAAPRMRQIVFSEPDSEEAAQQSDRDASPPELELSRLLLGLYVDGIERTVLMAMYDGEQYLMPIMTVLNEIGATLAEDAEPSVENAMVIDTPGGRVELTAEGLRIIDGQILITQQGLQEQLLVDTHFSQRDYALFLLLPWSLTTSSEAYAAIDMPEPDFEPPAMSLRSLRGDLYVSNDADGLDSSGQYYMSGSFNGGAWQARVSENGQGELSSADYFLSKDFDHSLFLLGNADYSLHPLMSTVEQTGIQYLFSSRPLSTTSEVDISRAHSVKRLNNGVRTIAGQTQPGAVAELRVDGKVRSRVRARLDGSYEFPNQELPTRGFAQVEVLIRDHRTGALLEIQDFSRRSGVELLGDGQHSVFAALGQEGNPLDPRFASRGLSSALQWRYGLTEDVTLELGHQQVGQEQDSAAALSMALSRRWFGSLAATDNAYRSAASLALEGGGEKWKVDFGMQESRLKTEPEDPTRPYSQRLWDRYFNLQYGVTEGLSVGLIARNGQDDEGSQSYVLPNASWSNRRNLSINVRPNYHGEYRLDSRFTPSRNTTLRYTVEESRHALDLRYIGKMGQEYYGSVSMDEHREIHTEVGMSTEFENQRFGSLQFGVVGGAHDIGYALDWESRLAPGVNSRLRVSKAKSFADTEHDFGGDEDFRFTWQLTFDFAVAQRRIVPADSQRPTLDSATLTGDLIVAGERLGPGFDVDRLELLINGDNYTAIVQGGRYYLDGLQPGMHKVTLDSRHLPLELSPVAGQSYWVRLEKSAVTEVPIALEVKYSAAGRIRDQQGANLANARLRVVNEAGETVESQTSDQFGLYRTGNLAPGRYRLQVSLAGEAVGSRELLIENDYLFNQDVTIERAVDVEVDPRTDSPFISL